MDNQQQQSSPAQSPYGQYQQVTYRDPTGQVVTSSIDQAPPQVQAMIREKLQIPQAGLQQTQTSTQATNAQIPGIQANSQLDQINLARQQMLQHITGTFKSTADKNGYVDSGTYNSQRKIAAALGINGDTFDTNFSTFVNPTNQIKYNTSAGQSLQQKKATILNNVGAIQGLLSDYNNLGAKGPIEGAAALNPASNFLGAIGLPTGGAEKNYEARKQQIASSLQDIVNKTNFTGLGLDQSDVASMVSNLPSVTDPADQAQNKIDHLNKTLSSLTGQKTPGKNPPPQGGNLLTGLLGDILNPGIDATNKAMASTVQAVNNPENKGNIGQSVSSALQAVGALGSNAASTIPSDVATAAVPEVLGKVLGLGGKAVGKVVGKAVAPAEGATMSSLGKLAKYFTTTQSKTGNAIQEAAGKGGMVDWDTVVANAREQIANKGVSTKNALERLINQESPAQLGKAQLTSPQALEQRIGLGSRLPQNFFEKALQKASTGKNVQNNEAISALRNGLSDELKRAAPDIQRPDEMYSFIKKMHGDAPTWAKRIALGAGLKFITDHTPLKGGPADFLGAIPEAIGLLR